MQTYDTIILGAGPAGLTAGTYLARARQKVLILDAGTAGGQVVMTHAVANYPGISHILGYKLASQMKQQAIDFGCELLTNQKILEVQLQGKEKRVQTKNTAFVAKTIIIATGGQPRSLGLASEKKFAGTGISYCATCDGDFFTDQDIIVVGGGNSALEEAVSLTQYARSVTIVHQFDHFQGYPHAIAAAQENQKIKIMMEHVVKEFTGTDSLESVLIEDKNTHKMTELKITGAFVLIGYIPNSQSFVNVLDINERNEILTNEDMGTSIPGVYAAGDVRAKKYRQITTAVNDGTVAALSAMEYMYGADPEKI